MIEVIEEISEATPEATEPSNSNEIIGDGYGEGSCPASELGECDNKDAQDPNESDVVGDGIGEDRLSFPETVLEDNHEDLEGDAETTDALIDESHSKENSKDLLSVEQNTDELLNVPESTAHETPITDIEDFDNSGMNKESSPPDNLPTELSQIEESSASKNNKIEGYKNQEINNPTGLDDNGNIYIKDGKLLPNTTYELNGNIYETDDEGRIVRVEATVSINNEPRSSLNNQNVEGMQPGDEKGHLIAHILGGADKEGNLVAMSSELNRGEYKSMELAAKRALEEGKHVNMFINLEYEEGSKRPKSITATLEIDDEITVKKFLNK